MTKLTELKAIIEELSKQEGGMYTPIMILKDYNGQEKAWVSVKDLMKLLK